MNIEELKKCVDEQGLGELYYTLTPAKEELTLGDISMKMINNSYAIAVNGKSYDGPPYEKENHSQAIDLIYSLARKIALGESVEREEGIVANFSKKDGYGFIKSRKGETLFFSRKSFKRQERHAIGKDLPVSFVAIEDSNGNKQKHRRATLIQCTE